MAITISSKAADELKKIIKEQGFEIDKCFLKVATIAGGCAGFSYNIDIVDNKDENDNLFESNGINIICDLKSSLFVNNLEIGWQEDLTKMGFVFHDPDMSTCGCGKSFCPTKK